MDRIRVRTGDITAKSVDAIVNAANETLMGGGGVDGAIHRAAGRDLLDACYAITEVEPHVRCPTGEARITPGFLLPAKYVIHTVGPVWKGGEENEPELLANCYRNSLKVAVENNIASIAFPAISCGIYRFPVSQASRIAVETVASFLKNNDSIKEVILVAFDKQVYDSLTTAVDDARRDD